MRRLALDALGLELGNSAIQRSAIGAERFLLARHLGKIGRERFAPDFETRDFFDMLFAVAMELVSDSPQGGAFDLDCLRVAVDRLPVGLQRLSQGIDRSPLRLDLLPFKLDCLSTGVDRLPAGVEHLAIGCQRFCLRSKHCFALGKRALHGVQRR